MSQRFLNTYCPKSQKLAVSCAKAPGSGGTSSTAESLTDAAHERKSKMLVEETLAVAPG